MQSFEAPIPGESLTSAPKAAPWERPPEIVDPEEAIEMHLSRLSDPERMQSVVDALELGVDIKSLTTGLLRSAVANGIHTVDVSLLVAPVVHEFIKKTAEDAGIEYDEGLVDEENEKSRRRQIEHAKAKRKLKKAGYLKGAQAEESPVEATVEAEPTDVGEPASLVKRRGMK